MRPNLHIAALLLPLLLTGCLGKIDTDDAFRQQIVVEGRIEQGRGAEVMLTLNLPYTGVLDEQTLENAVIRWAKVSLSCEGETEVLTGYYDENYITHFVYRSNRIVGEVGKSYQLTVEYSGRTLTAQTTIPHPAALDDLLVTPVGDSLYTVRARFRTLPSVDGYLFDCRTSGTPYFRPALLGVVGNSLFPGGEADVTVNRPLDYTHIKDYTQYFRLDETLEIRFSSLESFAFDYWSRLENEVLNALNPIFPSYDNLPSNIEGDGYGIWCGYASRYYEVRDPRAS